MSRQYETDGKQESSTGVYFWAWNWLYPIDAICFPTCRNYFQADRPDKGNLEIRIFLPALLNLAIIHDLYTQFYDQNEFLMLGLIAW